MTGQSERNILYSFDSTEVVFHGWYGVEMHPKFGAYRWSGPHTRSEIIVPIDEVEHISFKLTIIGAMSDEIIQTLQIDVNGYAIETDIIEGPHHSSIITGEISATVSNINYKALIIGLVVLKTIVPNTDSRSLGIAVSKIEFEIVPTQADKLKPLEFDSNDVGTKIAQLIKPLLQNNEYHKYSKFWATQGFQVLPDYYTIERQPFETHSSEKIYKEFKPNLFLLGAAKSGTTTLYTYLQSIPTVCMSDPKEPYFFECEYQLGLDYYRSKYFSHWMGESVIGDARQRNLYLPFVAERIYKTNPEAKLVIILRNPVDRAYSHWWYWYARGIETLDFEEAIRIDYKRIQDGQLYETREEQIKYCESLDSSGKGLYRTYLDSGYYAEQINRYLQYFSLDQIKILWFEELKQNPFSLIQDIQKFLGVEYYDSSNFVAYHVNQPYEDQEIGIKRPPMASSTKEWLYNHYYDHNKNLQEMLNLSLAHWAVKF